MIVNIIESTCVHTSCYSITTFADGKSDPTGTKHSSPYKSVWWTALNVFVVISNVIEVALCIAALAVIYNPPNGSK